MPDPVRIERQGPVATVILDRPGARNAVDPATAAALAAAFLDLERDDVIRVSVLWGAGGTFCAGADLKAVAAGWDPGRLRNPSGEPTDAFGPMGPTRLRLDKPVIAAVATYLADLANLTPWRNPCALQLTSACTRSTRTTCRRSRTSSSG